MTIRERVTGLLRLVRFGTDEENIRGGILFIVAGSCFIGITLLVILHAFDPGFNPFGPALYCDVLIAVSLALLFARRLTASVYLLVLTLLGFVIYQLAFQVNGIHESAVLVLPGVLIIAGLLLKRWEFIVFTLIILISITIILLRESSGIRQTPFSGKESSFYGADILVILAATAFTIAILARSYLRNLIRAKESEARLRELNSSKDKFFSIISHDLRSPFNNIIGLSELLREDVRELDIATIENYAGRINTSAMHTYQLLENLLQWARLQQGNMPFLPKEISINKIIESELAGLRSDAGLKNIELLDVSGEKEILLLADENMIRSILRNLVSNAIKFTPRNGKVEIACEIRDNQVSISVSDNGIGIEPEMARNLFRIETARSAPGTDNEKGNGLGLLLCREFAEKHGGSVSVVSKPGEGSTFTLTVPYPPSK